MVDPPAATTETERAATDSPWFWAMLFACAALVGLVVIAPKYTVRHDNIQRQDQGRWEVWRRHGERTSAGGDETLAGEQGDTSPDEYVDKFRDEYVDVRQHEPTFSRSSQTGLWILRTFLIVLVIFTTVAWRRDVWRERMRVVARTDDMPADDVPVNPSGGTSIERESGGEGDGVAI